MADLRDYKVINQRLVRTLALQLGLPLETEESSETSVGLSSHSPVQAGIKRTRKAAPWRADDPRLLEMVVAGLRDAGQLSAYRPERLGDPGDPGRTYVHEVVAATQVLVPTGSDMHGGSADSFLTLWVSDPSPPRRPRQNEWDYSGSFLFLVEEVAEAGSVMMFSGISALRLIVLAAQADADDAPSLGELVMAGRGEADTFGRWFHDHPLEKLRSIGSIVGRTREIETVYKIAYMSDEQSFTSEAGQERVCDIFAYPLYIAD